MDNSGIINNSPTAPVELVTAPAGTLIEGPEGMGYRVRKTMTMRDPKTDEFLEPFGGAPVATGDDRAPRWLFAGLSAVFAPPIPDEPAEAEAQAAAEAITLEDGSTDEASATNTGDDTTAVQ